MLWMRESSGSAGILLVDVHSRRSIVGNWRVNTYKVPDTNSSIMDAFFNKTIHEESGGLSDVFAKL